MFISFQPGRNTWYAACAVRPLQKHRNKYRLPAATSTPSCQRLCTIPGSARVQVRPAIKLPLWPTTWIRRCFCNHMLPWSCKVFAAQLFWLVSLCTWAFQSVTLFHHVSLQRQQSGAVRAGTQLQLVTKDAGSSPDWHLRPINIRVTFVWVLWMCLAVCTWKGHLDIRYAAIGSTDRLTDRYTQHRPHVVKYGVYLDILLMVSMCVTRYWLFNENTNIGPSIIPP